jgi:ABC-2 type transport system ATP-binding protein
MIEAVDLEKKYDSFTAVQGVNFTISSGEIVGLLGPNGAGKTTIMKILTCYHYPSAGRVAVKGLDIREHALAVKRLIGYLPENAPVYPELNVREYLEFIAETRIGRGKTPGGLASREAIEKAVEACALKDVWLKGIDTISKGYRQRVGLAQAILHEPDILILDEPTTGLDPNQILEIRHLITELGKTKTVLLSTHILQEVEAVCKRVLILNKGRIVAQGTTGEIANEMRGDWCLRIRLRGDLDAFRGRLAERLPGAALDTGTEEGEHRLSSSRQHTGSLEGFQEAVFDCAVASGVKLLQIMPETTSLEDVFTSLTKGDADE